MQYAALLVIMDILYAGMHSRFCLRNIAAQQQERVHNLGGAKESYFCSSVRPKWSGSVLIVTAVSICGMAVQKLQSLESLLRIACCLRSSFSVDAWRIRPKLDIPLHISAGLTAVDLTHDEEMPQEPEAPDTTHVDRLLQRQADAKTAADCAMEVSHVVQLSEALLEAEAAIEESFAARHRYLNVQKEHEDNLEQQGGHKRRATGSTRRRTPAPAAPLPIHLLSHKGSPELPWPLIRFDLMLHKSASYYAIWRRFLHLNEYLRTFTPETADATIDEHARGLTEHLV